MFHVVKRSLGWYKPVSSTNDSDFERVYSQFEPCLAQTQKLLVAFEANDRLWLSLRDNCRTTMDAVLEPGNAWTQAKGVAVEGIMRLRDSEDATIMQEVNGPMHISQARCGEARKLLLAYRDVLVDVRRVVERRHELLKEMDYYRGKFETLSAKGGKQRTEEDRTRSLMLKAKDGFLRANITCLEDMHSAIDLKDAIYTTSLSAFVLHQQLQASSTTFFSQATAKNCPAVVENTWPDLSPLQQKLRVQLARIPAAPLEQILDPITVRISLALPTAINPFPLHTRIAAANASEIRRTESTPPVSTNPISPMHSNAHSVRRASDQAQSGQPNDWQIEENEDGTSEVPSIIETPAAFLEDNEFAEFGENSSTPAEQSSEYVCKDEITKNEREIFTISSEKAKGYSGVLEFEAESHGGVANESESENEEITNIVMDFVIPVGGSVAKKAAAFESDNEITLPSISAPTEVCV